MGENEFEASDLFWEQLRRARHSERLYATLVRLLNEVLDDPLRARTIEELQRSSGYDELRVSRVTSFVAGVESSDRVHFDRFPIERRPDRPSAWLALVHYDIGDNGRPRFRIAGRVLRDPDLIF